MSDEVLCGLKSKIETEVAGLNTSIRTSLRHAKAIGECLSEAKQVLKAEEKGFVTWVKENCPFSYPSAANYMKVAKEWDRFDEDTLAKFTIREFLDAVAERAPRKKAKVVQTPPATGGSGDGEPPHKLTLVTSPEEGTGEGQTETGSDRSYGQGVPDDLTVAHTSIHPVSAVPSVSVTPQDSCPSPRPTEIAVPCQTVAGVTAERVAVVAREVGLDEDKLVAALVKLGVLSGDA